MRIGARAGHGNAVRRDGADGEAHPGWRRSIQANATVRGVGGGQPVARIILAPHMEPIFPRGLGAGQRIARCGLFVGLGLPRLGVSGLVLHDSVAIQAAGGVGCGRPGPNQVARTIIPRRIAVAGAAGTEVRDRVRLGGIILEDESRHPGFIQRVVNRIHLEVVSPVSPRPRGIAGARLKCVRSSAAAGAKIILLPAHARYALSAALGIGARSPGKRRAGNRVLPDIRRDAGHRQAGGRAGGGRVGGVEGASRARRTVRIGKTQVQAVAANAVLHLHQHAVPCVLRKGERPTEILVGGSTTPVTEKRAPQHSIHINLAVVVGSPANIGVAASVAGVPHIDCGIGSAVVLAGRVIEARFQQADHIRAPGPLLPLIGSIGIAIAVAGRTVGCIGRDGGLVHAHPPIRARNVIRIDARHVVARRALSVVPKIGPTPNVPVGRARRRGVVDG